MKSFFLLGLLIFLLSCNNTSNVSSYDSKVEDGKYFFDFDELIHYKIKSGQYATPEGKDDKNTSPEEQLQIDLIFWDKPDSIEDTSFVSQLEIIGFEKKQIDKIKSEKINKIFREKKVNEVIGWLCIAEYRDILIFKKNNEIIGMAKICFSCDQNIIYGTTANTINFGQDGDYGKLHKILNE